MGARRIGPRTPSAASDPKGWLQARLAEERQAGARLGATDGLGNGLAIGDVVVGVGLDDAGRAYTVRKIHRENTVTLERHLDGKIVGRDAGLVRRIGAAD